MALEALSSNEFLNFIIYDTISATPQSSSLDSLENSTTSSFFFGGTSTLKPQEQDSGSTTAATTAIPLVNGYPHQELNHQQQGRLNGLQEERVVPDRRREGLGVQGIRKRRRRKPRVCKNKEEAETQRMTHIAVERNRRKQMNEHLTVLRSLMPESYVQRGDQASIVGGAIEFVKELEHLLQSLEARKLHLLQRLGGPSGDTNISTASLPPFAQFFPYPQYTWSQVPGKFTSKTKASIADIEVTLIETHANMRILSRRSPRQLSKLVAGFQTLHLSILHINVTTMDPLVLFSISAKLEEGCQLATVDDIAGAVHHMLRIIEEDTALC